MHASSCVMVTNQVKACLKCIKNQIKRGDIRVLICKLLNLTRMNRIHVNRLQNYLPNYRLYCDKKAKWNCVIVYKRHQSLFKFELVMIPWRMKTVVESEPLLSLNYPFDFEHCYKTNTKISTNRQISRK